MTVFIANENNDLKKSITRIINAFSDKIDFSKKVFLKPNIVFPVDEKSGMITRKNVVKALIEVLRDKNPDIDIIIGEGTAAGSIPEENFKVSGYLNLARNIGVKLIDLNQTEHVKINWHYGNLLVPKIIFERTYINLPILKKSTAAGISGAMKNQKGLLVPAMKKGFHKLGLHDPIAYLNQVVQPDINILDGSRFFSENLFFAGDNTGEIDYFISNLLCDEIPEHILIFKRFGLIDDNFPVTGDNLENLEFKKIASPVEVKKFLGVQLWSNPRACSMCRYLFQDAKNFSKGNYIYFFRMWIKLIKYSILGANIIYGSKPSIPECSKKIICVGNCNKKLAQTMGYRFVPGCPPLKKDMLKYF